MIFVFFFFALHLFFFFIYWLILGEYLPINFLQLKIGIQRETGLNFP